MESVLNTFYLANSRVLTYQCTSPILHLYPLLQFSALACPSYDPSDRMADQPFTFPFFCCLAYSALTQFLQEKSAQLAANWPAQHNQTSPEWESWHIFLMCTFHPAGDLPQVFLRPLHPLKASKLEKNFSEIFNHKPANDPWNHFLTTCNVIRTIVLQDIQLPQIIQW